ncbi:MAG: type II toxin-antitoxin system VapC family toxin [Gemmatimonadetes bacterium]|nr:type II toxin-antitoxin system VapC family toxin [Gemmatimonadota bacterium]MDQ3522042.1 type II toxin-antitoxin system VapC family toxin [Gemmatimonadota bacterium]
MSRVVLDTSALIAYLKAEPVADRLKEAMKSAESLALSTASLVEAGIVAERLRGPEGARELDHLIQRLHIQIIPFTADHAALARSAFRRFGKGRHPAGLNFGDCFSYALARFLGEPLLFVGDDFSRTDIQVAQY